MRLSKSALKALKLEQEQIDAVTEWYTDDIKALEQERDGFKSKADEYDKIKDEYNKMKKGGFEQKYNDLKTEYDKYKAGVEGAEAKRKKQDAYSAIMKDIGISEKVAASILKLKEEDIDKVELDEKGKAKNAAALKKSLKEEWGSFIPKEFKQGTEVVETQSESENDGSELETQAVEFAKNFWNSNYGNVLGETDGGKKQ